MIPKLKFEVVDNPEGMIDLIEIFLLNLNQGFDWRGIYSRAYPEFGKLIEKKSEQETKKIARESFMKLYKDKFEVLEKTAEKFQKDWDKIGGKPLLDCIQEIYDNRKSFEDFMKKSWEFVKKHRSKI